jgi:hypothetical protein
MALGEARGLTSRQRKLTLELLLLRRANHSEQGNHSVQVQSDVEAIAADGIGTTTAERVGIPADRA